MSYYQHPPYQPPYPPQYPPYPTQYPVQQVHPYRPPVMSPQEYEQFTYRRRLKRTANGLGGLLLTFVALETIILLGLMLVMKLAGIETDLTDGSALSLLESGVISSIVFFVAGAVYCLITKKSFAGLFPFEKTGASMLVKLCVIGISFSLMGNYVVGLVDGTFGLFGISNGGGNIDAGSQPNVLLYFLTVAVMPALVEEFAFRGVIMGSLRPYSEGLAILISSAVFALMHGNFVQMPFTFCCGLVFAYLDIKANSLLPSIIVHFLNNGLSVLSDVLISYKILDENAVNFGYGVIFAVTGVLTFFFLKSIVSHDDGKLFRLKGGNDVIPFKNKVKAVLTSPTMIIFAVIMALTSITYLSFFGQTPAL